MPQYIVKLRGDGTDYFMEWSTIVDAPVTHGMSWEEFEEYYRRKYREAGMAELPARMERVNKNGTSSLDQLTARQLISGNRAGSGETELTTAQIIDAYCVRKLDEPPMGKKR